MKKLKNIICFVVITMFVCLTSCTKSSNNSKETSEQPPQAESSGQIVEKYVNTLTTAKDKANKAASAENDRLNQIEQEMNK